jgi:hypothetical protein
LKRARRSGEAPSADTFGGSWAMVLAVVFAASSQPFAGLSELIQITFLIDVYKFF